MRERVTVDPAATLNAFITQSRKEQTDVPRYRKVNSLHVIHFANCELPSRVPSSRYRYARPSDTRHVPARYSDISSDSRPRSILVTGWSYLTRATCSSPSKIDNWIAKQLGGGSDVLGKAPRRKYLTKSSAKKEKDRERERDRGWLLQSA